MSRWLYVCVFVASAAALGCSDDGPEGPPGPAFLEACGEDGLCGAGLVCRTDDTVCVGDNTLTLVLDFPTELQQRFEPINVGLLTLQDRELIAEAQRFDPSLVQLFSTFDAPSDWPAQLDLEGVPAGDQWVVITMALPANMTSYGDNRFEISNSGTLFDFEGEPAEDIAAVFYTELPVGSL